MLKLRNYQVKAKTDVLQEFKKGSRRVILCKPTGAGKTVTFASIVTDAAAKGSSCMVLCDRKELISQARGKLQALGIEPTIIAPGHKMKKARVYLASVDTLRLRELPEINLLIIDEAHKQSFDSTLDRYKDFCDPFVIGATATPLRTGQQNCLSERYQAIVEPVTIGELLQAGYLVPARFYSAPNEELHKLKRSGTDFDQRQLFEKFNQPKLYAGVVANYSKFTPGKKAIVFNVNVEHSLKMAAEFNAAGIPAKHLDGKTPGEEREQILEDYAAGKFLVLCNCSVLTTGFDEPTIEVVIINRATASLALWLQMLGRGSRTAEGKDFFTVIDHGANVWQHGFYDEARTWQLEKKRRNKGDGVAPVKLCPACELIISSNARSCKYCGHEMPAPVKKKELLEAEFKQVFRREEKPDAKKATYQELEVYAKQMGYKRGWVYHQLKLAGRA